MAAGRGMAQQRSQLSSSQDTLVSLAGETGGRAFTDTNDFGEAFTPELREKEKQLWAEAQAQAKR